MSSADKKQKAMWNDLQVEIVRLYEGPPLDLAGVFHGSWFTVWHLLRGKVLVRSGDEEVRAETGEWLVRRPGIRFQQFSEDAEILSLHLFFQSRHNAAQWQGPAAALFPDDPDLEAAALRIRDCALIQSMRKGRETNPTLIPSDLNTYLDYRSALLGFLQGLMERLGSAGMVFDAPKIHDERVRASFHTLIRDPDFSRPFSREDLAAAHGLSPSRFGRLWQQELGMTPKQFREKQKIVYVQDLLQNTEMPIKEICYRAGFTHLSHFSLWFKRHIGEPPRAYRTRYLVSD